MALKRDSKGRFLKEQPAIFASTGSGTCGFKNLTIQMKPNELNGEKGKIIEFLDGKYQTSDPEEIAFLKYKEKNPIPYSRIKCVQEPILAGEEEEEDKEEEGKGKADK